MQTSDVIKFWAIWLTTLVVFVVSLSLMLHSLNERVGAAFGFSCCTFPASACRLGKRDALAVHAATGQESAMPFLPFNRPGSTDNAENASASMTIGLPHSFTKSLVASLVLGSRPIPEPMSTASTKPVSPSTWSKLLSVNTDPDIPCTMKLGE